MRVDFTLTVRAGQRAFTRWMENKPDSVIVHDKTITPGDKETVSATLEGRAYYADLSIWTRATDVQMVEKTVRNRETSS